ncbi:MAG TPA: GNAT family N-acetyltransferase [Streptosporangiaceae bacterium]|nr:GNAT family N-acetyltransferase [Streptosporangiaceae bacterium]
MVTIRPAVLADAEAIAEVMRASWFAAYSGIIDDDVIDRVTAPDDGARVRERFRSRPWSRTVVACDEPGSVVGYASFGPERDMFDPAWPPPLTAAGVARQTAELYALYVHPDAWSAGRGRALMELVLAKTAKLGYPEIVLWVLARNARARRFYEQAGYVPDGASHGVASLGNVTELRYRRPVSR